MVATAESERKEGGGKKRGKRRGERREGETKERPQETWGKKKRDRDRIVKNNGKR